MSRADIDAIFAAKKRTPPESAAQARPPDTASRKRKRRRETKQDDRFRDSRGPAPRRKTADGYSIYKEDELQISTTGGDTPLCPFDCQCCF